MGLLDRVERRASPENPNTPLTSQTVLNWLAGDPVEAGVTVSAEKALGLTAVWAAHRIVSEGVGSLPAKVRRRTDDGSEAAPDHPVHRLVHQRPNPELTPLQLFEMQQHHLLGWGNAYAEIQWTRDRSEVVALWPLLPDRTHAFRRNKVKMFKTRVMDSGTREVILPAENVLHIPGLGFNGLSGYSPITVAKQALGAGLAVDAYVQKFFGQGASMGGTLEHPKTLSDGAARRLKADSEILTGGLKSAHRWALLEEGMTANPFRINPEDSQLIEARKFGVGEIARIYGVPPHMLGDLDRPFQSNVEQMGIQFVQYTLRGWLVRWEQCLNWSLFTEVDRGRFFVEFIVEGLLRGDYQSRMEGHKIAREIGVSSANDILRLEGRNPIDGDYGDAYLVQQNQVMITADGKVMPLNTAPPEAPVEGEKDLDAASELATRGNPKMEQRQINTAGAQARQRIRQSFVGLFERESGRLVAAEAKAVRRALEDIGLDSGVDQFEGWLTTYYGENTKSFAREAMTGAVHTLFLAVAAEAAAEVGGELTGELRRKVEVFADEYLVAFGERHVGKSLNGLLKAIREAADADAAREAIDGKLAGWEESRAAKIASNETIKGAGAATMFAFAGLGVSRMIWVHLGESCPLCESWHGRTVEIRKPFAAPGDRVPGGEGQSDLIVEKIIRHPPMHTGCDCGLAAG